MLFDIDPRSFVFGNGDDNEGNDLAMMASDKEIRSKYDFLIFADSKGMRFEKDEIKDSWTYLLAEEIAKKGHSVLMITRPKVITVFFTLINFTRQNKIQFDYLVTNMGFVDHTPKKKEFLLDIEKQLPQGYPKENLVLKALEEYTLSSGEKEWLYSFDYSVLSAAIGKELSENFKQSILIGVIEFDKTIKIDRARPDAFFKQLQASNDFIHEIGSLHRNIIFYQYLRKPLSEPEKISYDAVHFTKSGHRLLFENLNLLLHNYNIT